MENVTGFALLIRNCADKRLVMECSDCTCSQEECRENLKIEMHNLVKKEFGV